LSAAKIGASIAGMANDNILLGDIAARGATKLNSCGRCDRHRRLSVQRLLAQYGPDAAMRRTWLDRIADARSGTVRSGMSVATLSRLFSVPRRP